MNKKKSNHIKCSVSKCDYNNEEGKCSLDEVSIGCMCNDDDATSSTTLCESFESSGSPITDNEYEVDSEDYFELNREEKDAIVL